MRIALDSNIFIYALEQNSDWSKSAIAVLRQLEGDRVTGVASVLCLSEVLAAPFMESQQMGDDAQLFMEGLEGLDYIPMNAEIAIRAGRLRAAHGPKLKTPDSIHLATALWERADYFVTNDRELLKLANLKIILLGEPLS